MNFAVLGAALAGVALLAGCAGETQGPGTLECSENCSLPQRDREKSTDPVLTPTSPNANSNVAKPVTPATPPTVVPSSTTTATTTAPPPPPVFTTIPITRKYLDGDHLFTRDANEAPGWTSEGQPFLVFDAAHPDTQAIYRCRAGTQHFVSNDSGCEGQISEGELGWLSTMPGADRFELVRCRNATGSDHLASTREECNGAGYVIEGTLGYAKVP